MLFSVIFPFINSQLVELDIARPDNVGAYSSSLESVTAVFNLFALLPAAWLGLRFGRKRPILIGVLLMCLFSCLFGLGTRYWQLMALRSLLGIFSAQAVITRTMIAEIATPETIVSR
jgi:MFS family permease